jgi:hypothetical protein
VGTRPAILVDTNIIIEAVRVGAWERLRAHEAVVTVRRCREEALSGVPGSPGRVPVTEQHLDGPLTVADVSDSERAALALSCEDAGTLDAGERDLLAHAQVRVSSDQLVIVCADQAAVRVAISMGLGDQMVSLEDVLHQAGIKTDADLKHHYTRRCLENWKTKHALGM